MKLPFEVSPEDVVEIDFHNLFDDVYDDDHRRVRFFRGVVYSCKVKKDGILYEVRGASNEEYPSLLDVINGEHEEIKGGERKMAVKSGRIFFTGKKEDGAILIGTPANMDETLVEALNDWMYDHEVEITKWALTGERDNAFLEAVDALRKEICG